MERKQHILVVDDESDILDLLEYALSIEGFEVNSVSTGERAIELASKDPPDLMILDIMLPGMNGLEVLKYIRNEALTKNVPIIILSAKSEETDIVVGLELGACDYVTKPFSIKVLISRIKAVLRNQTEIVVNNSEVISIGKLVIYPRQRQVTFNGKPVELTNIEFNILKLMAKKPGWVFSRSQIMDSIHNEGHRATNRSIDVHIYGLRKKLGPGKMYLQTVHSAGYRIAN
jgi:two-component system phosphate regulon response regulator PhoB